MGKHFLNILEEKPENMLNNMAIITTYNLKILKIVITSWNSTSDERILFKKFYKYAIYSTEIWRKSINLSKSC